MIYCDLGCSGGCSMWQKMDPTSLVLKFQLPSLESITGSYIAMRSDNRTT